MTKTIEPIVSTEINTDHDSRSSLMIFELNEEVTALKVIRSLGFTHGESSKNPDNNARQRYVGSGTHSRWNDDKALMISIDRGCHCEHDCCGHACGDDYKFELLPGRLVVTRTMSFNY
jgi:hypothetical protein